MSKESNVITIGSCLLFWGFVVIKAWGHVFAAWSWWWLFLPLVPWLGLLVTHFNL